MQADLYSTRYLILNLHAAVVQIAYNIIYTYGSILNRAGSDSTLDLHIGIGTLPLPVFWEQNGGGARGEAGRKGRRRYLHGK